MARYATDTKVSVEKSRAEIERILQRYGCEDFAYRSSRGFAQIAFKMNDRMLRFDLELPDPDEREFRLTNHDRPQVRTEAAAHKRWEQACRQRWRALVLIIKAKLEAVESGITTFDIEFMAHTIAPGGKVFHEVALPQIEQAYQTGHMPPLLSSGRRKKPLENSPIASTISSCEVNVASLVPIAMSPLRTTNSIPLCSSGSP